MKTSSKPLNPTCRASITLQVPPRLAIELDENARRHGTNRHQFILQLIREGLERLPASDTASQRQS